MPAYVDTVLTRLRDIPQRMDKSLFNLVKENLIKGLKTSDQDHLYKKASGLLNRALRQYSFLSSEILSQVEKINFEDVQNYSSSLVSQIVSFRSLYVGNVHKGEVGPMIDNVLDTLNLSRLRDQPDDDETAVRPDFLIDAVVEIPQKTAVIYKGNNTNMQDTNGLIVNYYQVGVRNYTIFSSLVLLRGLLNEDAFSYLRTQKQLGYVVFASIEAFGMIDGVSFTIEGSQAPPHEMDREIETFLGIFDQKLRNMTKASFKALQRNVAMLLTEKDQKLSDKTQRYWKRIVQGDLRFDVMEELKTHILELKQKDVISIYNHIFREQARKLSIQVYSQARGGYVMDTLKANETFAEGVATQTLLDLGGMSNWTRYPAEPSLLKLVNATL
jgi:secreted Zn-dependent insulinase-like peptidase